MLKSDGMAVGGCSRCYLLVIMVLLLPNCSMGCEDSDETCSQRIQSQHSLCNISDIREECCQTCMALDTEKSEGVTGTNREGPTLVSILEIQPTTLPETTGDYITHPASEWVFDDLTEQVTGSASPELDTLEFDDAGVSTTESVVEASMTTNEIELKDDMITPETDNWTQDLEESAVTDATTVMPPSTVSYETSEPTEAPSSTNLVTKEDVSTQSYPTTNNVEAKDYTDDYSTEGPEVEMSYFGEDITTTESDLDFPSTAEIETPNDVTEDSMELKMTTDMEEPNKMTTTLIVDLTEDSGESEETNVTTRKLPSTVSYETSEPTAIPSSTSPATKEDLFTQPYPPTDSGEEKEYTGEITPASETTDDDDGTTTPGDFTKDSIDEETTSKYITVTLPVTVSYETSEPTEVITATSPATKEDLSTKPQSSTKSDITKEITTYGPEMTTGMDMGEITDDVETTGQSTTTNTPITDKQSTIMETKDWFTTPQTVTEKATTITVPRTISFETSEPTEILTATRPATKEDLSTKPQSSTRGDITKETTTYGPEMTTGANVGEITDDTETIVQPTATDTSITGKQSTKTETKDWFTTPQTVPEKPITITAPRTISFETSEPMRTTSTQAQPTREDFSTEVYESTSTKMTKATNMTSVIAVTTVTKTLEPTTKDTTDKPNTEESRAPDQITSTTMLPSSLRTGAVTTNEEYATEESVMTQTTTIMDEKTDSQTTTTPLPTNCSEPNSFDNCEEFLITAPYLCYDASIQQGCCTTCIAIANAKKTQIKTSNCPYGDQQEYCEDLDETTCDGSSVTQEHCCESCQIYLELNTIPPKQTTITTEAATTSTHSTPAATSTTVKKDDETNPIVDPQITTTPLPSNCTEANSVDDCESFLMTAPYLCYHADIQQRCCSTCIAIANAKKMESKIGTCPYGDKERYCEDLDETICDGSSMAREHCCETCHKYLKLNTVPPNWTTKAMEETTSIRISSTAQSSSKHNTAVTLQSSTKTIQRTTIAKSSATFKTSMNTEPATQSTSYSDEATSTIQNQPPNLPTSIRQPSATTIAVGKQLGFKAGNLEEGAASILVVVLPAIAAFVVILLVVLFVTIRHTSRVQRYLFRHQPIDAESGQLEEDMELR